VRRLSTASLIFQPLPHQRASRSVSNRIVQLSSVVPVYIIALTIAPMTSTWILTKDFAQTAVSVAVSSS
jgi:hypothetical protein